MIQDYFQRDFVIICNLLCARVIRMISDSFELQCSTQRKFSLTLLVLNLILEPWTQIIVKAIFELYEYLLWWDVSVNYFLHGNDMLAILDKYFSASFYMGRLDFRSIIRLTGRNLYFP